MTAIYRKYRPQTFSEIIGQTHIVQTLSNAILHNRVGHAYLFTGPRGTGKTTMARIFAKAVNCTNLQGADPCLVCDNCQNISGGKSFDVFEIDAASNTGVENIRELRETVKLPPTQGKYKIYIIDEVHMLSTGAFNALLKTLEEPPMHVIFILATTEIHKVPETIISRCQRYDFTRLSLEYIIEKLSLVAQKENIEVEKNALEMIAIAAEGGMRDAESLFAQVISLEDKKITAKEVEAILGTSKWESLFKFGTHLLEKNSRAAIELLNSLAHDGYDLEILHKSLLNFLRQILLISVDKELASTFSYELTNEQNQKMLTLVANKNTTQVLHIVQCFAEIQGKIKTAFIPQLPLELAIVKACSEPSAAQVETSVKNPVRTQAQSSEIVAAPKHVANPASAPTPKPAPQPTASMPTSFETKPTPVLEKTVVEPTETTSEPIEAAPLPQGNFTFNDVERKWHAFCEDVKHANHSLATVFPVCRLFKVEGNTIFLATKYPFHRDKLNEQANQLTLEASFAKILGSSVRVKAVTMQEAGLSVPNYEPQGASNQGALSEPKETSSLLSEALGMLGGQIVE